MNEQQRRKCGERATLIVTLTPAGTATNVARERIALTCSLFLGHSGSHVDTEHAEQWDAAIGTTPTLLRHEDD
jgi:hypothetical protein